MGITPRLRRALSASISVEQPRAQSTTSSVSAQAALQGTLSIALFGGFSPAVGQTFTVLAANPQSGSFPYVDESAVSGPVAFEPTYSGTSVVLVAEMTSTTTIASSLNPSLYGQAVTFTATVKAAPPNTGTPTGTVAFYNGASLLGTATLSNGKATLKTSALPMGTDQILAVYAGDNSFAMSTSTPLGQVVGIGATTSTVTASANPSVYGQTVTLTATVKPVAPATGTPTGSVTFLDGGTPIGTGTLSAGKASLATAFTLVGSHSITATYAGDGNFLGSNSPALAETVNQAATTSKVTTSANPSVYGQTVTFTATVSAKSPGAGTPTGSVTFFDAGSPLGTGTLSSGTATLSIAFSVLGAHPITVGYGGDSNFAGSTSATLSENVNQAATTTSVTSAPNPSVYRQSLSLTATVSPNSPASGTPTGTVTFTSGSTVLGSGTLAGGSVTITTSVALASGNETIKAAYGGDVNFKSSAGTTVQTVNQDGTTTAVVSSSDPSVYGQSVTFTAIVARMHQEAGRQRDQSSLLMERRRWPPWRFRAVQRFTPQPSSPWVRTQSPRLIREAAAS